jgi:hypothetical protein
MKKSMLFVTALFLSTSVFCMEENSNLRLGKFLREKQEVPAVDIETQTTQSILPGGCVVDADELPEDLQEQMEEFNLPASPTEQAAQVGLISRIASETWSVITSPFRATAWCVEKGYNATGSCVSAIYKTTNGIVYVVGITTTGLIVYAFYKGELHQKVLIRDITKEVDAAASFEYLYQMNVPFFGKVMWEMPEAVGVAFQGMADVNHKLNQNLQTVVASAEGVITEAGKIQASIASKMGIRGLDLNSKRLLESLNTAFSVSVDGMKAVWQKAAELAGSAASK